MHSYPVCLALLQEPSIEAFPEPPSWCCCSRPGLSALLPERSKASEGQQLARHAQVARVGWGLSPSPRAAWRVGEQPATVLCLSAVHYGFCCYFTCSQYKKLRGLHALLCPVARVRCAQVFVVPCLGPSASCDWSTGRHGPGGAPAGMAVHGGWLR